MRPGLAQVQVRGSEVRAKWHLAPACTLSCAPEQSMRAVQVPQGSAGGWGSLGTGQDQRCWEVRCPPAGASLIASMQFELISCFRWNSANQCRKEAETGAIKLTSQSWL